MKIQITETQLNTVIKESNKYEPNYKAAELFDLKYGTDISMKYDFSPYTEDEVWKISQDCVYNHKCNEYSKLLNELLPKIFTHVDVNGLDEQQKHYILVGMVSGYNVSDILWFSINGVGYSDNVEQHELNKELPKGVSDEIRWVLSPETIKKIRNRFL